MNKKMSELFHEFVYDDELNGNDEIIRETNAVVAEDDVEVRTMLDDGVGEKYFYRCMELAENVIKSFENEQPQLNDDQKIVLEWLKKQYHEPADWQFPLFILKNAITDMPGNVFAFYNDLNEKEEFELLIGFAEWRLEQEEAE